MWHKNVKATACPGANLYKFLPEIRDEVLRRMKKEIVWDVELPSNFTNQLKKNNSEKETSNVITPTNTNNNKVIKDFSERFTKLQEENPWLIQSITDIARNSYNWLLISAKNKISKIAKKYTINEIKNMINQNISVLLYELTANYSSFEIVCDMSCLFNIDGMKYSRSWATLTILTNKIQINSDRILSANNVSIKSTMSGWTVKVSNYNRKSYVWVPWNSFKWELKFEKWTYPLKNWDQKSGFVVINTLPFSEYMKWIVETNDTETLEKNKVMAMIAKNYALFYMDKWNIHPNVPEDASYTAIDDPNFFQKYVWAWLEKTLTKRYQALESTKNKVVMFDGYLPILPYFNCSAGFTLSAEEKWWWTDTPYLKSVYDFKGCSEFVWHGVWLAWKWAERLAQQWLTYDQILKYFYNGISIESF